MEMKDALTVFNLVEEQEETRVQKRKIAKLLKDKSTVSIKIYIKADQPGNSGHDYLDKTIHINKKRFPEFLHTLDQYLTNIGDGCNNEIRSI
jgi:hypothetical protein